MYLSARILFVIVITIIGGRYSLPLNWCSISPAARCRRGSVSSSRDDVLCCRIRTILCCGTHGTEAIRGIVLKLPEPYEAKWDPSAFSKIPGLVLLIISSELRLPRGLNCLPRALKVLVWNSCPLSSLPLDVPLNELVILEMPNSKMSKPWSGLQFFNSLKSLKLSHSIYLIQTPNFKGVPNLESLDLEGCINLGEIHPSLGMLEKLVILNLKGCENLQMLPEFDERMKCLSIIDLTGCKKLACLPNTFNNLASLKSLNLSGCSKFSRLPSNLIENMALEELDFSDTAIREVPTSIGGLPNLKVLSFRGCKAPPSISWKSYISFSWLFGRQQVQIPMGLRLPPSFSGLSSLQKLDLSYCDLHDESIPSDFGSLTSLEILDLSGNNFVHFPVDSISNLLQLRSLKFDCCPRLQSLPRIPPNLETVHTWNCPLL
ncbi:TMV resistance protein N-like [Senna tora]|uniref:TMV resistance protein N-like n=1 Tax=Senna tora TaxID=362788 RepID=A0A834T725_9FABA|nr:TMV resistance protein N-like [Senna tora]